MKLVVKRKETLSSGRPLLGNIPPEIRSTALFFLVGEICGPIGPNAAGNLGFSYRFRSQLRLEPVCPLR